MPALSDYTAGTITLTNGSVNFTGAGTGWQAADFREGDTILGIEDNAGVEYVIASIDGNGAGTLTQEWEGATGTYTYRMRYLADGARVTAQARNLIELLGNGNLQALAGLTGPGVPVFNGPHAMEIKPVTDFVNGVAYDVQVDTLADRAAYDGQSEGFAVLVSDVGDGRSALFSKASNTSGDWTDPAHITGPVGPLPEVGATVTSLPPGSTPTVTPTPITGGVRLDFDLPGASGFYNAGVYDIAEAYSRDDVVRHNGSSFIALQAVPVGTSPSNASPPVDTAYWQVLAAKGADGTGTGDVVGPSGAVADRIAVFDGTTGKLIKDGGKTIAGIQAGLVKFDAPQSLTPAEQGQARANIGADVLAGFRNKIINGDFDIWQRGLSASTASYVADRWLVSFNGAAVTTSRQALGLGTIVAGNPKYYCRHVVTGGVGAADFALNNQRIEGVRTFAGKRVTLTLYARADAVRDMAFDMVQYFGTGGAPSATVIGIGAQKVAVGTGFARISLIFDVPSVAGKTEGANDNDSLWLRIWFSAGADYNSVTNTLGLQAGTFDIAHVSLVEGEATAEDDPFAARHAQQELALCQRYYENLPGGLFGPHVTGQNSYANWFFKVRKRTVPTIGGTLYLSSSLSLADEHRVQVLNATQNPGLLDGTADAEL